MNFDARDLMEVNQQLLEEAVGLSEPTPAVVVCLATWGRGADPKLLAELQPYRVGLGFNGSVVARVPRSFAESVLPAEVVSQWQASVAESTPVCAEVFRDWLVESW